MLGIVWLRGACRHLAMVPRIAWSSCEVLNSGTGVSLARSTTTCCPLALRPRGVHARMPSALGLDGFDGGRDQVVGDVGARNPRTDEGATLVLGLNAYADEAGVC